MDPKGPVAILEKESEKKALSQKPKSYAKDSKFLGWFLTYPQCTLTKEQAKEALFDRLYNQELKMVEWIFCEEKHKDGNPHLHAFVKLDKKVRCKGDRFDLEYFDYKKHGEYQPAKSWKAVIRYIVKESKNGPKNYISNFDVEAALKKQNKKIGIAELERDPLELLEEGVITGFQLVNFCRNQNMYKLLKQKRQGENLELSLDIPKKRHFWFYGPSNSGKTYNLKKMIMKDPKNWFQIPTNNDWVGYNNEQNLYIDEYKGQLSIQELNRICDGGSKVNIKGGSTILHPQCYVYICSNYNIKDCYSKCEDDIRETLYNRFNEKLCSFENNTFSCI